MQNSIVIVDTPSFCTYMDPDGEEVLRKWMESNYTRPCKWAGILYMHDLYFNPEDTNLRLSNHLNAFRRTCRRNLIPSIIHIVPTLSHGARLSDERLRTLTILLQRQADAERARLYDASDGKPFDGKPEAAWNVVQELLSDANTRSYAQSSVTVPYMGSSYSSSGSERVMPISPKRQASDESAQPKKPEVTENDYVIFVVGPTGAGKTRFTRQLSKSRNVGGHPGTENVEAWRCNLDNGPANIMVIDVPSFHTGYDNTTTDWLKLNFTEKCHPGILFLHSLDSDPTSDDTLMSRHLETFAEAFPSKFTVPSRVYVVPTINSNSTLSSEALGQRLLQLNTVMEALSGHGNCKWHASMFPGVFKGQQETAWSAALLLLKTTSQIQAKESTSLLLGPALKRLAPQFLDGLALTDLLVKEFRKNSRNCDLGAIITFGRTAIEFTPPNHPRRYPALIILADILSERFNEEGTEEDLDEVITLRREVSEYMSPNDPQRLAIHLELDKSLSQRFRSRGALVDLKEIISLRRVVLESTPALDRCKPLLSLADSLYEKYRKLDLRLSQELLARYLKAKIRKGTVPARVSGLETDPSSSGSSIIEQLIEKVVFETLENTPPRLLHTESGILCNRDAQLSKFKDSLQYKRLLSRRSSPNSRQLEVEIKDVVSEYFAFATLSHRWGSGEPLLRDVEGKNVYDLGGTDGLAKLQDFCILALQHSFQWAWSDTCCIDKDSSAELQEAIGSMFSWYHRSSLTIVYLADVALTGSLANSIWFKRGWTLQELLASNTVLFYAQDWSPYMNSDASNHKTDPALLEELCKTTQISERYLRDFDPGMEDARSRLCWASRRRTTRPEDMAYSLFGIFKVQLPVLYGETAEYALGRLLAEIISGSGDVSVLDWVGKQSSFNSCFPASLVPYRTAPRIRLIPGDPAKRELLDLEKAQKLYSDLARLPLARCVHRRIMLPSIIYPVTAITMKVSSAGPPRYTYQIHASQLTPLEVTSSVNLDEGAGKYILVRPWHPRSLRMQTGSDDDAIWNLLEQLKHPFNALLLERLLHNEYKRITCDCMITACAQDPASILDGEVLTLEVVRLLRPIQGTLIVRGPRAVSAALALERPEVLPDGVDKTNVGSGLIRLEPCSKVTTERVVASRLERPRHPHLLMDSGGDASLLCEIKGTFFCFLEEAEDYCRDKRRKLIDHAREQSIRAILARDREREGATDEDSHAWGSRNEGPHETQQELLRRTAVHIISSSNPAQLDMRILANDVADERFAFLCDRWSRAWNAAEELTRQEKHEARESEKPSRSLLLQGLIIGLRDSEEGRDEPSEGEAAEDVKR
ncbi:hypothetical protein EDD16DRAFT_1892624 [Pisolithus croceorrhizus]|nr:hypothetical protein EDD16DRAFT_1892624 [Pisolithus croceorrhizus]